MNHAVYSLSKLLRLVGLRMPVALRLVGTVRVGAAPELALTHSPRLSRVVFNATPY